jgi:hypothetical protein
VTYRSEGPNIDWAYLKKLHPAIHVIRAVNAHMESEFKTRVRGVFHTTPKWELDVIEMQKWYRASDATAYEASRKIASKSKLDHPKDIDSRGAILIQTGTVLERWVENRTIERATTQDWDLSGSSSDSS